MMTGFESDQKEDELIISLHKEIEHDLFNWDKVAQIGEILSASKNQMDEGEYDNWVETKLFIAPKFVAFYIYIYQNKELTRQFKFKHKIPDNLIEIREILLKSNKDFKAGNIKKSEMDQLTKVSRKIMDYVTWIMEDRGLL
jgi:hypothetical protein